MSSAERTAACSCGQLSLTVRGEPVRISICHCLACQRRTGGPFAQQARWRREDASPLQGRATQFTRVGDEGGRAIFDFCPACGATVRYVIEAQPDLVAIPVGAFADPSFPPPHYSVYGARRHAWVQIPPDTKQLD